MAALHRESLLSSPDLLAKSVNDRTSSPVRDVKRITVATPTKMTVEGTKNIKLQDFYLNTPQAGLALQQSPTRSVKQTESHISPWRIRVRVEAEREGQDYSVAGGLRSLSNSPSKRARQTKTITVPLKDGDDSSQPPKRGRGRPRGSTGTPAKRRGTPKPTKSRRAASQSEGSEAEMSTGASPKRRGPGRPRKSSTSEVKPTENKGADAEPFDVSKLITGLTMPAENSAQKKKNASRRRRTLAPVDIAIDSDASINDEPVLISTEGLSEDTESSSGHRMADQARMPSVISDLVPDVSPPHSPLQSRSSISPQKGNSKTQMGKHRMKEDGVLDPTEDHDEYDSIMESEGFTMVSLASLPSAQQHLNLSSRPNRLHKSHAMDMKHNGDDADSLMHVSAKHKFAMGGKTKEQTPSQPHPSPHLPPPVQPSSVSASPRAVDKATGGTPKLVRVVKAGIALQGILEPPAPTATTHLPQSQAGSSLAPAKSPRDRLDDLFSGFGDGTRRELRAGLRFGEELAKRQRLASRPISSPQPDHDDVFQELGTQSSNRAPTPAADDFYTLSMPRDPDPVTYPTLPKKQLPSPENSLEEGDEDAMDWKVDSPHEIDARHPESHLPPLRQEMLSSPREPINDTTMMEREAEWQREREAVSREIEQAGASQVIVVGSDDPTPDIVNLEREASGIGNDDITADIWQAEAQSSSHLESQVTADDPQTLFAEGPIKPRRSKLPTPWRKTQVIYSDEIEPEDALVHRAAKHAHSPITPAIHKRAKYLASDHSVLSEFADQDGEDANAVEERGSPVRQNSRGIFGSVEQRVRQHLLGDRWKGAQRGDKPVASPLFGQKYHIPLEAAKDDGKEKDKQSIQRQQREIQQIEEEESMHDDEDTITLHSAIRPRASRYDFQVSSARAPAITAAADLSWTGTSTIISQTSSYLADYSPNLDAKTWLTRITSAIPSTLQTWLVPSKPAEGNQSQSSSSRHPNDISIASTSSARSATQAALQRKNPPNQAAQAAAASSPHTKPTQHALTRHLPWTKSHYQRLRSLYLSALEQSSSPSTTSKIPPLNPSSPAYRLLGLEVESLGWRKRMTALELGVVDAFLLRLLQDDEATTTNPKTRAHTTVPTTNNATISSSPTPLSLIDEIEVTKRVFSLWAGRVQRGETELRPEAGEEAGEGQGAWDARFEARRVVVLARQREWKQGRQGQQGRR